jgi:hypothetical protein
VRRAIGKDEGDTVTVRLHERISPQEPRVGAGHDAGRNARSARADRRSGRRWLTA